MEAGEEGRGRGGGSDLQRGDSVGVRSKPLFSIHDSSSQTDPRIEIWICSCGQRDQGRREGGYRRGAGESFGEW
jgi:hypothetical protein